MIVYLGEKKRSLRKKLFYDVVSIIHTSVIFIPEKKNEVHLEVLIAVQFHTSMNISKILVNWKMVRDSYQNKSMIKKKKTMEHVDSFKSRTV